MGNQTSNVKSIVGAMVLAPSAHNTQPWKFAVSGDQIDIFVDWSRHLTVSDPTERELYVSIGCAIANGRVTAAHAGYSTDAQYFPEGAGREKPVARIRLMQEEVDKRLTALYEAVGERRTNRLLYDAKPLEGIEQDITVGLSQKRIIVVEDRGAIKELADISGKGTFSTLSRKDFKEELSHWVRNSWTRQPDGMPGYAMGIPAPVSLFAPLMVRIAPIQKKESKSVKDQIESSSAVVAIVTEEDSAEDWMEAGELLELVWLRATAAGLAACTHAAAIEASEEMRNEVKQILRTDKHPQALLRIGHAKKTDLRATPRRSVQDCLIK